METLKLHWLGQPLIELKGQPVKLETRKAAAMLAYLSLTPGACQREVLATMFWPEGSQQKALANLRRTLSSINSSLPKWIEANRETISLKKNAKLWVDIEAFDHLLSKYKEHGHPDSEICKDCLSALDQAIELYRGDFLKGLNLTDSPGFDEWQFFQRDSLRQEFATALQRLSSIYARQRDWDQAIVCARRWRALDYLHEPACRVLMDLYTRSGQRTAALRQYEELARLLQEQLKQEPEQETRQLYEQLLGKDKHDEVRETPEYHFSFPLLKTKLYIPAAPARRVNRTRLVKHLDEIDQHALTVISAPAGFGKTTLLSEWITQSMLPVAWLSLDNGDNDPYRFLAYLTEALESIHEDIALEARQIMQSPQLVPVHIILASLINQLGSVGETSILVLDDYQFITEHAVHEAMTYLLDHLPSNLHVVIAGRADPPLQLGRLRAHGQMLELRTQDLRFTSDEAAEFLNEVMRLGLSTEDIDALEARTEGWVVGLQMAGLSLRGHENASEFIQAFSGSHRYVLDYLMEEVLRQQLPHIKTFLLETSILEKLNGVLCDALMSEVWKQSGESGQAVLEYLERNNLFLIPLDDHKQWYRYHHLFADLLQSRLQQYRPEMILTLNLRAAEWFENYGSYPEAIVHSIAAQDFQHAAGLIERVALKLLAHNELSIYLSWLDALPMNIIQSHPWLEIYQAWISSRLGKLDDVEPLLQAAEHAINLNMQDSNVKEMVGCIALVRANVANLRGDFSSVIQQTESAHKLISKKNVVAHDNADFQLGYAHFAGGDLSKSKEVWLRVVQSAIAMEDLHTFANVKAELANIEKLQGKLTHAFEIYREAEQWLLRHSTHPFVFTGVLEIGMADSLREWNKLEEASQLVLKGINHARAGGRPNTLCFGHFVQAHLRQALHDMAGTFTALNKAEQILSSHTLYPRSAVQLETTRVKFWLSQGNLRDASRWADERLASSMYRFEFIHELESITLARVLLAKGMLDKASKLLTGLAVSAARGQRTGRLIEILVLHALASQAAGDMHLACEILLKSVQLAEPERYMRIFLDEGKPMIELLRILKEAGLDSQLRDYIDHLLDGSTED